MSNVVVASPGPATPVSAQQASGVIIMERLAGVPALVGIQPLVGIRKRVLAWSSTSPGRLARAMLVLLLVATVDTIVQMSVISHVHSTVETIGISTRPSIVAAERASATLADMDTEAINDALLGGLSSAGAGVGFHADMAELSKLLISASRNITFESTELPAIDEMQNRLAWYYAALGETRVMALDNPWTALQRLKWSSRVNRDFTAPAAEALREANNQPMEAAYRGYDSSYLVYGLMGAGAGALLLLTLVGFQVILARRTNRLINIPLAVATVLVAATQVFSLYTAVAEHNAILNAKTNAFDSVASLYRAKVSALRANADESMWLLDKDTRAATATNFRSMADAVLSPSSMDVPTSHIAVDAVNKAMNLEKQGDKTSALAMMPKFTGFLGQASDNVTFGIAERQPLSDAVDAFMRYVTIDRLIRSLENSGSHLRAVELGVGVKPGVQDWSTGWTIASFDKAVQAGDMPTVNRILGLTGDSDWAFTRFTQALDKAIQVNEDVFDHEIGHAMTLLRISGPVAMISFVLAMVLSALGLFQRYEEYRG